MSKNERAALHFKVPHGQCPICQHYGDDCTGVPRPSPHLVAQVRGAMQRATGKVHRVLLEDLDDASLRELLRFMQDIEHEKTAAARRAQRTPWRRP